MGRSSNEQGRRDKVELRLGILFSNDSYRARISLLT